jgi:hypothetical protein
VFAGAVATVGERVLGDAAVLNVDEMHSRAQPPMQPADAVVAIAGAGPKFAHRVAAVDARGMAAAAVGADVDAGAGRAARTVGAAAGRGDVAANAADVAAVPAAGTNLAALLVIAAVRVDGRVAARGERQSDGDGHAAEGGVLKMVVRTVRLGMPGREIACCRGLPLRTQRVHAASGRHCCQRQAWYLRGAREAWRCRRFAEWIPGLPWRGPRWR